MATLDDVKLHLKARHIKVPDDWLTACIEWIRQSYPTHATGKKRMLELVYEQWLLCDLSELATHCLPCNLKQEVTTVIQGHFALQVNQVCDVGQAAYPQLQKIRQEKAENSYVSAEDHRQPDWWEPKPSRMLMLQMTDGTREVQGMEYHSIPNLNVNLKPGTKVLLSGIIFVRRGVMLLKKEHITILGGEVEALLVSNALENVLARKLGAKENPQPREYEDTAPTQLHPSQSSCYYPSQLNSASTRPQNIQPPRREVTPSSSGYRSQANFTAPPTTGVDEMDDDDFFDQNMEMALSQIECQELSSATSTSAVTPLLSSNSRSSTHTSQTSTNTVNHFDTNNDNGEDMNIDNSFFDDDFDEILIDAESQINESFSSSETSTLTNITPQTTSKGFHIPTETLRQPNGSSSVPGTSKTQSLTGISKHGSSCSSTLTEKCSKPLRLTNFLSQPSSQSPGANRLPNSKYFQRSLPSKKSPWKYSPLKRGSAVFSNAVGFQTASSFMASSSRSMLKQTSLEDMGFKTPATPITEKKQENINSTSGSLEERVKHDPPFTYLVYQLKKPLIPQEFTVRGFITTLLSNLGQVNGRWKLTALINDGSASWEVDMDDMVLRELLGINAEEFNQKKAEAKSNPVIISQITMCIAECQKKLMTLSCLLHLRVAVSLTRPRLMAISYLTNTVTEQLRDRSSIKS
ncbi:recQ-mediated genome instability protein 1-like [Homarus americanus]|nr:recQ-mediated genome instability protein 1-like [Homarus americanus]